MKRLALLVAGLLLVAGSASAGPGWDALSITTTPQNVAKVVAATDKLMASPVAKDYKGTVTFMASVIDGNAPGTHTFITAWDSRAEAEAQGQRFQGDPAWTEFLATTAGVSQTGANSRMVFLKEWGDSGADDMVWEIHAFTVTDPAAFSAALDTLMNSEGAKGFPGSVHLSGVQFAGMNPSTHLISVGYASEAEQEAWTDEMITKPDWAAYLQASQKVASNNGSFLLRTIKTWGTAAE
jgi:hypothetical protein